MLCHSQPMASIWSYSASPAFQIASNTRPSSHSRKRLCTALALLWPDETPPYSEHALVDQAVTAVRHRTPAAAGWARPGEVRVGLTRAVVAVTVAVAAAVTVASPAAAAARTREERIVKKLGWKNRRQVPRNEKGEANRPDRL